MIRPIVRCTDLSGRSVDNRDSRTGWSTSRVRDIRFCDNASFLSAWDEIFVNRIYDIEDGEAPLLVDAGANIGLAALFGNRVFPLFGISDLSLIRKLQRSAVQILMNGM